MNDEAIFHQAAQLTGGDREAFLRDACGSDAVLRQRIDRLLRAYDQPDGFMAAPALEGTRVHIAEETSLVGTIVADRYKLLEQIGEGGMGAVWVADQTEPVRRKVALKLVKAGMDSKSVLARFEAERQALALMDHPNIAKVLDGGATAQGRPFFVMEYVKGVPITDYCDSVRLTVDERLELFIAVCQAVQHAHQKGIVHRDLKPSNVLVCLYDGKPVPKVIDFGLAKAMHQPLTERTLHTAHGVMMGTPVYMSPEQAEFNNLDVDTRTDIYSLGVILYELLTGTTPLEKKRFRDAAWQEMIRLIKEEEPQRPSTRLSSSGTLPSLAAQRRMEPVKLSRTVRGDLDWIVMKALEKDRNRRYDTATGLARDVQRHLADEPVSAGPPTTAYRVRKFFRRHRATAIAASLVFMALVVGVVGSMWGMVNATRAERVASAARKEAEISLDAANIAKRESFDALTDLTDNTVGQLIVSNPQVTAEQRAFLDRIVTRYEHLAASLPEGPESLQMRARSANRVGRIQLAIGEFQRALVNQKKAVELFRQLNESTPDVPEHARDLLQAIDRTCVAYERLGRLEEAGDANEQGVALGEEFQRRFPNYLPVDIEMAVFYRNRAIRLWHDKTKRVDVLNRAIAMGERVVAYPNSNDDGSDGLHGLLNCLGLRAHHYAQLPDADKARDDVERMRTLMPSNPKLSLSIVYAGGLRALSQALQQSGHSEAAVPPAREGIQILEGIAERTPGNAEVRQQLFRAYKTLADALIARKQPAEAATFLKKAGELTDDDAATGRASRQVLKERVDLAVALSRISMRSGKTDDAKKAMTTAARAAREYLKSIKFPEQVERPEARTEFRDLAALCHIVGKLALDLEGWTEAIEFARKQLEFARQATFPGAKLEQGLANIILWGHWTQMLSFVGSERWDEALVEWKEMVKWEESVNPGMVNDGACREVAKYSIKLLAVGRTADPNAILAPGIERLRVKLAADPNAIQDRLAMRRALRVLGVIQEYSHRFDEALQAYDKVLALGILPNDKDENGTRSQYVFSALGRALCLDVLDKDEDAAVAWSAYFDLTGEQLGNDWRVEKLIEYGRPDKAVRLIEENKANIGSRGIDRYNAACAYALTSARPSTPALKREEYARRAIELLAKAEQAGFFKTPSELTQAKTDADLNPLRERVDFKKLLASLTERSRKTATTAQP